MTRKNGGRADDRKDKPQPVPPDRPRKPPVETPPDQPGIPPGEPDPRPKGDPQPNEPTRLVKKFGGVRTLESTPPRAYALPPTSLARE